MKNKLSNLKTIAKLLFFSIITIFLPISEKRGEEGESIMVTLIGKTKEWSILETLPVQQGIEADASALQSVSRRNIDSGETLFTGEGPK